MSLTRRKSRPFQRDKGSYRDDRLFIVACDDSYAPKQYFAFFKMPRIQVHVVATPMDNTTCHAIDVLARLKEIEYGEGDERWMLLDTDHYIKGPHIKSFNLALKEAADAGIKVALSKPCFELWLLLHHVNDADVKALLNAKETEKMLRNKLGEYNKTCLKQSHFSLEFIKHACEQAIKLDFKNDNVIPDTNTSRVYKLWSAIVKHASPAQVPSELNELFK